MACPSAIEVRVRLDASIYHVLLDVARFNKYKSRIPLVDTRQAIEIT
jgi:hypothetical protein